MASKQKNVLTRLGRSLDNSSHLDCAAFVCACLGVGFCRTVGCCGLEVDVVVVAMIVAIVRMLAVNTQLITGQ